MELRSTLFSLMVAAALGSTLVYIVSTALSTARVRALLDDLWFRASTHLDQGSQHRVFSLSSALLAGLFEKPEGFAPTKFLILVVLLNLGALISGFQDLDVASSRAAEEYENEALTDAGCGLLLFSPFLILAWTLWNFASYRLTRWSYLIVMGRGSIAPLLASSALLLGGGYALPLWWTSVTRPEVVAGIPLEDSGLFHLAAFYMLLTPSLPLMMAMRALDSCRACAFLIFPAGLSVCLPLLLMVFAVPIVFAPPILRGTVWLCEVLTDVNYRRLRRFALEVFAIASGIISILSYPG